MVIVSWRWEGRWRICGNVVGQARVVATRQSARCAGRKRPNVPRVTETGSVVIEQTINAAPALRAVAVAKRGQLRWRDTPRHRHRAVCDRDRGPTVDPRVRRAVASRQSIAVADRSSPIRPAASSPPVTRPPLAAPRVASSCRACSLKIAVSCSQAKLETKALKAKRPGFTDERYNETSYYIENGECLFQYSRRPGYSYSIATRRHFFFSAK